MKTFGERLRQARKEKGLKQPELAAACGWESQSRISMYEQGKRVPDAEDVRKLAKCLNVSAAWLQFGESEHANVAPAAPATRVIPVINYVQAGDPKEIVDDYAPGMGFDQITTDLELGPHAFALVIKGNSMEPDFKEGDKVIIDPSVEPQPGDFVVAKCPTQEATFKKYRPRGINENGVEVFELVPLNDDYPILKSNDKYHCFIVGTMVEHRRYRRR